MPDTIDLPRPPVSDRKIAANQRNAKKSTGPRTAEGKAKVSLNAVKHGLCSAMVVLPGEDPDEFEAMRQGWFDDWKPQTETRRVLVERAAAGDWRLRRCVKIEHDRLTNQMDQAVADYDAHVNARVAEGVRVFKIQPDRGVAMLRTEYEGVRGLIRLWNDLSETLDDPSLWANPSMHHARLLNLLGFDGDTGADDVGEVARASIRLLVWNHPEAGECDEPIEDEPEARRLAAELKGFIQSTVDSLQEELARFPDPELVRARVADSVAFDTSREGLALQRYEGQLDRSFRANLNQLIKLVQTDADLVEADEQAPTNQPTEPIAEPNEPNKANETEALVVLEPIRPNKPTDFGPPPIEFGQPGSGPLTGWARTH